MPRAAPCIPAVLTAALWLAPGSCASSSVTTPAPRSPEPAPSGELGLKAGFGRADITPPPGLGLSDYGPAGGVAQGHRQRLYARAMILEDGRGERIAWVNLDLGQPSFLLHRESAARIVAETGIGADRLVLTATHTHAGPGHFFSSRSYNQFAPGTPGFDPAVVEFLSDRVAQAIREAYVAMTRAVAGWVQEPVWGLTRNRSLETHARNPTVEGRPFPPPGLTPEQRAVDPTWTMLRVDTISSRGDTVPAGALSVFAYHPTGNPPANDLYDGDVSGLVARGLERHMDALAGVHRRFAPASVHLAANGAEGDVVLEGSLDHDCDRPAQRTGVRPGGPRTPRALDEWTSGAGDPGSECVSRARRFVNEAGDTLAARAIGIFDRAGQGLRSDLSIRRSFRTVRLTGPEASTGLCPEPQVGAGAAAGSEGSQSNLKDWKVLGLFPLNAREGAVDTLSTGCQAPKRELPWILRLGLGNLYLPTESQFMVVQIGDLVAAAVPLELTTEVGFRIRDAMLRRSLEDGLGARATAVVGLANGYMQYVATREEYQAQHYEGGSTLYGPGFAEYLQSELVEMTAELREGDHARVDPISGDPGARRQIFPHSGEPRPEHLVVTATSCGSDTVVVRWLDAPPGSLLPSDGPILELRRSRPGEETIVTWDDDRFVEVRGIESGNGRGYLWEARWNPPGGTRGDYSVTFVRWTDQTNDRGFRCP